MFEDDVHAKVWLAVLLLVAALSLAIGIAEALKMEAAGFLVFGGACLGIAVYLVSWDK